MVEVYHTENLDEQSEVLDDSEPMLIDIADELEKETGVHFLPQVPEASIPYLDPRIDKDVYPFESLIGTIKLNQTEGEVYVRLTPSGNFHNMALWGDNGKTVYTDSLERFITEVKNKSNS